MVVVCLNPTRCKEGRVEPPKARRRSGVSPKARRRSSVSRSGTISGTPRREALFDERPFRSQLSEAMRQRAALAFGSNPAPAPKRKKRKPASGSFIAVPGRKKPALRLGGEADGGGVPLVHVTRDGEVVLGEPLGRDDAKALSRMIPVHAVIAALASEVAKLRQELEHVKSRVT